MSSEQQQANAGHKPPAPLVEVTPDELVETALRTGTSRGAAAVGDPHEAPLTTPSGLLKTGALAAVIEENHSYTLRLALIIAVTLLAVGALLSFLTMGH